VLRASAGADDTVTAFSDVVPAIYGAALIPVSWPLALCRIGSFNAESASSFCTTETSRRFYFVRKAPSVESVGATLSDGDVDSASTNGRFAAQEVTAAIVFRSIINGLSNGEFLDLPKYWPIFARAEKLDVPVYLHPAVPHETVHGVYFADYEKKFPSFARPAWGYTMENGTQAIRLILSGIFDHHPNLKIIVGHFGETIPFLLWRIDQALSRPGQQSISFRDIFCRNFWVTTSGFFSNPALLCCVMEMGIDRILFAVDWPFVADSKPAVDWMKTVPLCDEDKEKILSGNAKRLLKL
jgi:hypothetical protein